MGTVALGASSGGEIPFATEGWNDKVSFEMTLTYADVAESRWQTTAKYLIDARKHKAEGRYEGVHITRLAPTPS